MADFGIDCSRLRCVWCPSDERDLSTARVGVTYNDLDISVVRRLGFEAVSSSRGLFRPRSEVFPWLYSRRSAATISRPPPHLIHKMSSHTLPGYSHSRTCPTACAAPRLKSGCRFSPRFATKSIICPIWEWACRHSHCGFDRAYATCYKCPFCAGTP